MQLLKAESAPQLYNSQPIPLADVPLLPINAFRESVVANVAAGMQLAALFGQKLDDGKVRLYAVLGDQVAGLLSVLASEPVNIAYPSLTPECPAAHLFEREIAEQWGVVPEGHPWLKPVRFHASYRPEHDAWQRGPGKEILPSVMDFYQVQGEQVHEVAVGPIHAGVIEPGHFRFQCYGEQVFHLEISLGFQHRGVELALVGGPNKRTLHYMETAAGDTTIGHATAYCQALEGLSGREAPIRAQVLRGVALELERLANHTGDLGALAGDVGFLPTASFCGRLRGDFLNASAAICGNRFGRSLVRPGGTGWDVDPQRAAQLAAGVDIALERVRGAARLLWRSPSVQARFEETGAVSRQVAQQFGMVGMAGRACGLDCDVRHDYPAGIYRMAQIPVSTWHTGDAFARAYVRWLEIERSAQFVSQQLRSLPSGEVRRELPELAPESLVVSLTEGWRGAVCHVAITDAGRRFAAYKMIDPSFHNWIGLGMALRNQAISDFPLCNKSFNLSYCGHDL